jgi:dienelactone hydrolase
MGFQKRLWQANRRKFFQASLVPGLAFLGWCRGLSPSAASPEDSRKHPVLADWPGQTVADLPSWQEYRQKIRRWWLEFLGLPENLHRTPPKLEVLQEEDLGRLVRRLIRYDAEQEWPTEAYLLLPKAASPERRFPGVVVFHSTTPETILQPAGLGKDPSKAFGLILAERGYVCLCPRCYLWSEGPQSNYVKQVERFQARHPGSKGMAKMLLDGLVAVDVLQNLPGVIPGRLGAVGHSLGAKEVLYLAAFDERIGAAIASEGGVGLHMSNWDAPWYLGASIKEPGFSHDHHELLALTAPRAMLVIGGQSADGTATEPYISVARRIYELYGQGGNLEFFNHRGGHAVPPEALDRMVEWFARHLG